jgi:hypothetical protein
VNGCSPAVLIKCVYKNFQGFFISPNIPQYLIKFQVLYLCKMCILLYILDTEWDNNELVHHLVYRIRGNLMSSSRIQFCLKRQELAK